MPKYNAIIIDDEIHILKALEILIEQNCPDIKHLGSAKSAEDGRQLLKSNDVHLIFLDISMPIESGFDFLASIPSENYSIIFTTAYEEYALKAIKANAIDYLLKPIDPLELTEAVNKAIAYQNLRNQDQRIKSVYKSSIKNLTNQLAQNDTGFSRITVVEKFGFRIVEVALIHYLEADSNYTVFHLKGGDKIVSSKSLGEYEKILNPDYFFRIHKSTIINLNFLKGYSSYQGYFAVMEDGLKLSISRRRFIEFKEAIEKLSKSLDS